MDLAAPHIGFVLVAYAISAVVLAGLTLMIIVDVRKQRSTLARLEANDAGPRRRRSPQQPPDAK